MFGGPSVVDSQSDYDMIDSTLIKTEPGVVELTIDSILDFPNRVPLHLLELDCPASNYLRVFACCLLTIHLCAFQQPVGAIQRWIKRNYNVNDSGKVSFNFSINRLVW